MMRFIARHRPSPSMAVALLALIVALGGTSYAAIKLPRNSVGAKQIKRNAVTGAKVKDASLFANDFAPGQTPKGPKGDPGPQGARGATGAQGPPGVTQVIVRRRPDLVDMPIGAGAVVNLVTMQLPAGKWWVSSVTNGFYEGDASFPGSTFRCYLLVNGNAPEPAQAMGLGNAASLTRAAVFAPEADVNSATPSTVVLQCSHESLIADTQFGPAFGPSRIVAVRAGSLDVALG
jgi:hypothetical protein